MLREYISKYHVACLLYGVIEEAQQSLAECLYYYGGELEPETVEVMEWLHHNLFSLSSHCFLKGETEIHQLPIELLEYIEDKIESFKEEIGGAPDFLIYGHPLLLAINKIRISVRQSESFFVGWRQCREMMRFLYGHPLIRMFNLYPIIEFILPYITHEGFKNSLTNSLGHRHLVENINMHNKILNRLSTYFFWVSRKEGILLTQRGVPLKERYWKGCVESFPFKRASNNKGDVIESN